MICDICFVEFGGIARQPEPGADYGGAIFGAKFEINCLPRTLFLRPWNNGGFQTSVLKRKILPYFYPICLIDEETIGQTMAFERGHRCKGMFLRLEMSYRWKGIGSQVRFWDKDTTQCRYKKTQTGNQDWQGDATGCQQQASNDWSRKSCSVKLASTCIS
jgi:hypothetical protein